MNIKTTIEIIPVQRFPRQGTIIADVMSITDTSISVSIFSTFDAFIVEGDELPIVIRNHLIHDLESECEIKVEKIIPHERHRFFTAQCIFINSTLPSQGIIDGVNEDVKELLILSELGERHE